MRALPTFPQTGWVNTTHVWIVEWLPDDEKRKTGRLLFEWMEAQRAGWARYIKCNSKREVLEAIRAAKDFSQPMNASPIIHIEAHGCSDGLSGPSGAGREEFLYWHELTGELRALNVVTKCNLVVFIAACMGFAGVSALVESPRAPANLLIGPIENIDPSQLLEGTKEFYRRWRDASPTIHDITEAASQQAGEDVLFVPEPFVKLAYESIVEKIVQDARPSEQNAFLDLMRNRLIRETALTALQIESQLSTYRHLKGEHWQAMWDEMFMLDLYPENSTRFELDVREIVRQAYNFQGKQSGNP